MGFHQAYTRELTQEEILGGIAAGILFPRRADTAPLQLDQQRPPGGNHALAAPRLGSVVQPDLRVSELPPFFRQGEREAQTQLIGR